MPLDVYKRQILMYLDCEESRDTAEVKKRWTAAETMLEKLEVSEAKYSYALDDACLLYTSRCV